MTRKHFEAIAALLDRERSLNNGGDGSVFAIAEAMADLFAKENPRFDRDKFLTACGYAGMV